MFNSGKTRIFDKMFKQYDGFNVCHLIFTIVNYLKWKSPT